MSHLPESIRQSCEQVLGTNIRKIQSVSGGDINDARLLVTSQGQFFVKFSTHRIAADMFAREAAGLALLGSTSALRVPSVIATEATLEGAFLLMDWVFRGSMNTKDWEKFGEGLAKLHYHTADTFGLDHDNYIGSLTQHNTRHSSWPDFYIQQRILPQFHLALSNGYFKDDIHLFERFFLKASELFPPAPPALVHGDLWSGNFLAATDGSAVLIDPAVSYSHPEMDLAMTRLFGGFEKVFYQAYEASHPLEPGFEHRLPAYQLYYLMVHVNLFGGAYERAVRNIIQRFV